MVISLFPNNTCGEYFRQWESVRFEWQCVLLSSMEKLDLDWIKFYLDLKGKIPWLLRELTKQNRERILLNFFEDFSKFLEKSFYNYV